MGGKAFKNLQPSAFPRMPPPVYRDLKARIQTTLSKLYELVQVPIEAPEKKDYGDLDLIVAHPKQKPELAADNADTVSPDIVHAAIGARHSIFMGGYRTSNYAVPIAPGQWAALGCGSKEEECRLQLKMDLIAIKDEDGEEIEKDGELYYQVDVHVCPDEAEWKRNVFFNSHGDMGMILGVIIRNHGLHLGVHGLKMPDPPNSPLHLSDDFSDILRFMGISATLPLTSFGTRQEVFRWIAGSRLFDPTRFRSTGTGFSKVKQERAMYHDFVRWAEELSKIDVGGTNTRFRPRGNHQDVRSEALDFFSKREAFEARAAEQATRTRLKSVWSGHQVRDWANMGEHWKGVKLIMDAVRAELGGDAAILQTMDKEGEKFLRSKVIETRDRLGLIPCSEVIVDASSK
ncbi:hypothetical protein PLEOSDRAFT_62019 [Pleurotus ostreatus PC15]|uniref:Uncharacterized protein n=1 Tax=Pleurotus ostreatus (strain PC15) TaxID=1137138 RepID=A0A067NFP9_PLEO1|nr:hypothetical protein PLEOSDRAFT_62019 [Pleurotus ostreatus PC15]